MPGPNDPAMSLMVATVIFLMATGAMLLMAFTWAMSNRRPVRAHARLVGRRATVYRHTPTQLQDERGISARARRLPSHQ
jgi:hypothetical protein